MTKAIDKIKTFSDGYLLYLLDEIDVSTEVGFVSPGSEIRSVTREFAVEFGVPISTMIEAVKYILVKEMADRFRTLVNQEYQHQPLTPIE